MKPKMMIKMTVDIVMTVLLLLLMAYHLTGDRAHEWKGAAMFVLFLLHHVLKVSWYKNLFRGRYSPQRILLTVINMLLLCATIGLIISGLILSRHVFAPLQFPGSTAFGRSLHHVAAHWGFVLMPMHLGLHGKMILGMLRKLLRLKPSPVRQGAIRIIALLVAIYGVYSFVKHQTGLYILGIIQFSFFDYDQPMILFFADQLAMMGLFAILAYYANHLLGMKHSKSKEP